MNFIRSLHLGRVYPSLSCRKGTYPEFFMFDYHDYMERNNGQDDKQDDKQQNTDLAFQDIRLVSIEDNDKENEKQFWKDAESDRYIAIIMVSFAPGEWQASANGAGEAKVFDFLNACVQDLEGLVEVYNVNHYIYQSMGYSDLCVAISTNNPNIPYKIATNIRICLLNDKGAHGFPPIVCDTYTLFGIRIKWTPPEDPKYEEQEAELPEVALRFCIDKPFSNVPNGVQCRGLYGRYDLTFTVPFKEFLGIFEYICWLKFSREQAEKPAIESDLFKFLDQSEGNILYVNERILLTDAEYADEYAEGVGQKRPQFCDEMKQKNLIAAVDEALKSLLARWKVMPFAEYDFYKCVVELTKMWNECRVIHDEADSFLAHNVFIVQLWTIISAVNQILDIVQENEENRNESTSDREIAEGYCVVLVECLHKAIAALDQNQRVMQSVNRQTLQSPIHGFQGSTDLGKYIVAYTEFARQFLLRSYTDLSCTRSSDPHQYILPIISIAPQESVANATPLFLSPYEFASSEDTHVANENVPLIEHMKTSPKDEMLILSVQLPDAVSLFSPYITIPRICHELAHNIRVPPREVRNRVLTRFIMQKVSERIVQRWLSQMSKSAIFDSSKTADRINNAFCEALNETFLTVAESEIKCANIGMLLSYVLEYLTNGILQMEDEVKYGQNRSAREMLELVARLIRLSCEDDVSDVDMLGERFAFLEDQLSDPKQPLDGQIVLVKGQNLLLRCYRSIFIRSILDLRDMCILVENAAESDSELNEIVNQLHSRAEKIYNGFVKEDNGQVKVQVLNEWSLQRVVQSFDECIQQLREFIRHLEGAPKFDQKVRRLINVAEYSTRSLIDAVHLVNAANGALTLCVRNRRNQCVHDKFLKTLFTKMQECIRLIRRDMRSYYSSATVQEFFVQLDNCTRTEPLFEDSVESALCNWAYIDVKRLVQGSTTLQREVSADLGMCTALNLGVFGYLRVLACSTSFMSNCLSDPINNAALGRAILVSNILVNARVREGIKEERVWQDAIDSCLDSLKALQSEPYTKKIPYLTDTLNQLKRPDVLNLQKAAVEALKPFPYKPKSRSGDDNEEAYLEYRLALDLWNTVHLLVHCLLNKWTADPLLTKHFLDLYSSLEKTGREQLYYDTSQTFSRMSCSYNSSDALYRGGPKSNDFKHADAFILHYYYMAWKNFGILPNDLDAKTCLNKWADQLVGKDGSHAQY